EHLRRFELPEAFHSRLAELLYKPDRSSIEVEALDEAASQLKLSSLRLLEKCGAIPSTRDYHFDRFLFEHFPRGIGFAAGGDVTPRGPLPRPGGSGFRHRDMTRH